eukprot:5189348-Prymnesium_polylepis.1
MAECLGSPGPSAHPIRTRGATGAKCFHYRTPAPTCGTPGWGRTPIDRYKFAIALPHKQNRHCVDPPIGLIRPIGRFRTYI